MRRRSLRPRQSTFSEEGRAIIVAQPWRPEMEIDIDRSDWTAAPARLPVGECAVAIGDVHGQAHLLEALHGAVGPDLAKLAPSRSTVVHLGDLTDRGARNLDAIDLARAGVDYA